MTFFVPFGNQVSRKRTVLVTGETGVVGTPSSGSTVGWHWPACTVTASAACLGYAKGLAGHRMAVA